jgi:hypothetical protein
LEMAIQEDSFSVIDPQIPEAALGKILAAAQLPRLYQLRRSACARAFEITGRIEMYMRQAGNSDQCALSARSRVNPA